MDARIDAILARLGIEHLAEREPFALSGGEQQRVAIASIVTMGTRYLVLDEPTAQLDPAGTASVGRAARRAGRRRHGDPVRRARRGRSSAASTGASSSTADGSSAEDVPGRALGSDRLAAIGLTAPTLVRLAEAAGLDPRSAFDEAAVAGALAPGRARAGWWAGERGRDRRSRAGRGQ